MTDARQDFYQGIYLSTTDSGFSDDFTNDFKKYCNFKQMTGGGAGVLMSCVDRNLGRTVAIKQLAPDSRNDVVQRRRLLREARITAQLAHPNTVPVYEIGKDHEGNIYFAMKKVEGENLFQIFCRIAQGDQQTRDAYSLDQLLEVLVQASNALAFAHTSGVIHRDVKPENILVGFFGEVYLMDWGVAKVWGMPNEVGLEDILLSSAHDTVPGTGRRPGTPLYMSPEQVRDRPVDERTDIFSMGVVLYELLALQEPFKGRNIKETFDNILHYSPPPPSQVSQHLTVPKRLDAICARAMEKNPSDRYENMREMIQDISKFRDDSMRACSV